MSRAPCRTGPGIELGVVIERLMMRLKIGAARRAVRGIDHPARSARRLRAVLERRAPSSRIPGPGNPPRIQPICDGGLGLRRQGARQGGIGIFTLRVRRRRRIAARLIRRLHGVHGMEFAVAEEILGRDAAAIDETRRAIQRGARRIRLGGEPRNMAAGGIRLEHRGGRLRRRGIRPGILGRARADEILMIEEGAAESALEELVGQHEFAREGIELRPAVVVVAHREPAGIRPCGKLVVPAAVDLHLMLEKPVHQIARHHAGLDLGIGSRGERPLDGERCIRQSRTHLLIYRGRISRRGHALPGLWKSRQHRAVSIALRHVRGQRPAIIVEHFVQPVRSREIAIQAVEGAILRVDHHDGRNLGAQRAGDAVGVRPG